MVADSDSKIAWHRVQLRKNREAVKALETARFTVGDMDSKAVSATQGKISELKRKIAQSERCIAEHERRTRRPLTTDLRTLASVSWSSWTPIAVRLARATRARKLIALQRHGPGAVRGLAEENPRLVSLPPVAAAPRKSLNRKLETVLSRSAVRLART